MRPPTYVPHVDQLLQTLRVTRERLNSRSKIAIEARLLRLLIQNQVAHLPFSEAFYRATYTDLAAAAKAGLIPDLHRHFVETGYFEGRLGAPPAVDEAFYVATYPDVAHGIAQGHVASATEHYIRQGAAEGRAPSAAAAPGVEAWNTLLRIATVPDA